MGGRHHLLLAGLVALVGCDHASEASHEGPATMWLRVDERGGDVRSDRVEWESRDGETFVGEVAPADHPALGRVSVSIRQQGSDTSGEVVVEGRRCVVTSGTVGWLDGDDGETRPSFSGACRYADEGEDAPPHDFTVGLGPH